MKNRISKIVIYTIAVFAFASTQINAQFVGGKFPTISNKTFLNTKSNLDTLIGRKNSMSDQTMSYKDLIPNCGKVSYSFGDNAVALAPQAAPCNGISVTSINFNNTGRTIVSGTNNTVGVVYSYPNAGIAPDGTFVDARVTVTNYSNNMDADQTNFTNADTLTVENATTAIGFPQNLQPSINQESGIYDGKTTWSGSIQYQINFFVAGTTTPKVLTVAATSIDNDGFDGLDANGAASCTGPLRETVTYGGGGVNQILINNPATTTQTILAGNAVQGPAVNQMNIGTGAEYANSALLVNVSQFTWKYQFDAPNVTCANNTASPGRYGSLNLACQVTFDRNFASVPLSGNVFNDTDGLTDSKVNGTGTNAGGLFANLIDANGFVVSSVAVAANGTYTFPVAVSGSYSIQLSVNQGIESSLAPVKALPAGWVNTGEFLGAPTVNGNDGTVNGLLPVTVGTVAIINANFGIEQPPTANNNTAVSRPNPGGTNSSVVPASTFSGTDTSGTISNIRITALPTGATSITINGTLYGAGGTPFPAAGVLVPTLANGNPTQVIAVDPIAAGATNVVIPYVTVDAAGFASAAASATVPFAVSYSLSGNVFNDTNGLLGTPVNTVDGTGTNAGGLFANLLDSGGNVVATATVAANGTYSFPGVAAGSYTVQLSTNQGTVGSAAPVKALPAGWVNTGEFLGTGAGSDGTPDGLLAVTVSNANIANANFGIEQTPTANNNTAASQLNPGGTNSSTVPPSTFTATDPAGGTVANIRITALPVGATSITINGTLYGAGGTPFPAGGVIVPTNAAGNPTQPILVDPSANGATNVLISYVAIDNAGVESTSPATATVPFTAAFSLSGNVFNDTNGLSDNKVNGTGTNAGGLFANLLDSANNVVATAAVGANGAYSFPTVGAGTYTVQLSTNQGTVGNAAPVKALPTGWVYTGDFLGLPTVNGNDGAANGLLTVAVSNANVANANFGIEQRPVANNNTAASQDNTGGTNSGTVPPTTFTATDPAGGSVSSIRITGFPSNADSITINGILYTSATFPAGGVTVPTNAAGNPTQPIRVDPIDGNVTVGISYVAIDNAGVESASPATANVPFTVAPTVGVSTITGVLYAGNEPLKNTLVTLVNTTTNQKVSTRTDINGKYSFTADSGNTYIVQPLSNKYEFSPSSRVENLVDDIAGIDFASADKVYRPKNDFDGDGKTDMAVYRPSEGNWYVFNSAKAEMSVFQFGLETDIPVAADYDGDGVTDYAVYRADEGTWYIWQSATEDLRIMKFGLADDKLAPADYDGDGKADVAVYRQGVWYIYRSSDDQVAIQTFGLADDVSTPADYDGDGKADVAVFRPSTGYWYIYSSSSNEVKISRFGLVIDVPQPADYDGDGRADIAQFRDSIWYVLNSIEGFKGKVLGVKGDKSIVGDFDGDGRTDQAVYHDGHWTISNSDTGTLTQTQFGLPTDIPIN